ncbi:LuxR family transcriptional regulator [Vibrio sinensis]|uniref:LuxR family transcriptional regulator n=1 Tax=Vibrio sinensis TaxID=2302434 RepID=A0A3A6Q7F2_9VIBR|nr:helix-turn-helix transcriptional regulator [Vibrio sinensis]RJX65190.1 LuxR family transcriptional regulator [Vibrio sinensis]
MEKEVERTLDRFSDLLEALYQAPTHPKGFQFFLERLAEKFALADAVFHINKSFDSEVNNAWIAGRKADAVIEYIGNHIGSGNYVHDYVKNKPMGKFYTLHQHIGLPSQEQLGQNDELVMAQEWFNHHQFCDVAVTCVGLGDEYVALMSLHRQSDVGPMTVSDIKMLDKLIPHIQRAFSLYQHFESAKSKHADISLLTECLPNAILLYDSKGQLVSANQRARDIAKWNSLIDISSTRCRLNDMALQQTFLSNLYFSLIEGGSDEAIPCKVLNIGEGSEALALLFVPIYLTQNNNGFLKGVLDKSVLEQSEIGSIIYLYECERTAKINSSLLQPLFSLTATETEICEFLVMGYSREEISQMTKRSVHTVKDHIKAIYHKTGTSRQSDLVATLLTTPAYTP